MDFFGGGGVDAPFEKRSGPSPYILRSHPPGVPLASAALRLPLDSRQCPPLRTGPASFEIPESCSNPLQGVRAFAFVHCVFAFAWDGRHFRITNQGIAFILAFFGRFCLFVQPVFNVILSPSSPQGSFQNSDSHNLVPKLPGQRSPAPLSNSKSSTFLTHFVVV